MRVKRTYQDKMDAVLDERGRQIKLLRDRVFEQRGHFDSDERRRLESLRDLYKRARLQLQAIKQADDEDWQDLRPEMDQLVDRLNQGLKDAGASRAQEEARAG